MAASIRDVIIGAADRYGFDSNTAMAIAGIESEFKANAQNSTSTAGGLFQFLDKTWGEWGNGGAKYDPHANADAGVRFMAHNKAYLEKQLGREVDVGEIYLAHQQGAGGALKLLANPNASAVSIVGLDEVRLNGGHSGMTAGQFANIWMSKARKRAGLSDFSNSYNPANYTPPTYRQTNSASMWEYMNDTDTDTMSANFLDRIGMAWQNEAMVSGLFDEGFKGQFNPDYRLTAESMGVFMEGLDDRYRDDFIYAMSDDHAHYIREKALDQQQRDQVISEAGLAQNIGARVIAGFLDPAMLALAAASGGAAAGAARGGSLLAHVGSYGVTGAADGVAYTFAQDMLKPGKMTASEYATAGAVGLALGTGASFLAGRSGSVGTLNKQMHNKARKAAHTNRQAGSVGAGSVGQMPENSFNPGAIVDLYDDDVARSAYASVRFDHAARMGASDNPAERLLGGRLFTDAVGKADGSVNLISVEEDMGRMARSWQARYTRSYNDNFKEWLASQKEQGNVSGLFAGRRSRIHEEFGEQITEALRNPAARAEAHPAVRKAASDFATILKEHSNNLNNPGLREGRTLRPVAGGINEVENYVPRMHDTHKFNALVAEVGEGRVNELISLAIRRGMQSEFAEKLDPKILARVTRGYFKSVHRRAAGIQDDVLNAFVRGDVENLRNVLQDIDVSKDDIDNIMDYLSRARPTAKAGEGGAGKATHSRTLIDESTVIPGARADGGDLRFVDLLDNDAYALMDRYNQWASSRIALGRVQIDNPSTGETWINGLTTDAEIEAAIKQTVELGADRAMKPEVQRATRDNLQFAFDRIRGVPLYGGINDTAVGESIRTLKDFNFARVMSQSGFAQIADLAQTVQQTGLMAALENLPELRRIFRMSRKSIEKTGLDQELELMLGSGTEMQRALFAFPGRGFSHEAGQMAQGGFGPAALQNTRRGMHEAASVAATFGGPIPMHAANDGIQMFSMRAAMSKLARDADRFSKSGKMGMSDLRRADLGMSDKQLKAVYKEINKHMEFTQGMFSKRAQQLNMGKWDPATRAIFENSMWRLSRRMMQENDMGQMHRWMSHPMAGIMLQFRSFITGAWTKNTLGAYRMVTSGNADDMMASASAFVGAMAIAGAAYSVQMKLQSIGREDPDEFLDDRLSTEKLTAAMFSRSGQASLLPMVIDTSLALTGVDPFFSYARTTGLGSTIFGNPSVDLFNKIIAGGGAIVRPVMNSRERSQEEYKALTQILPFQNMLGIQNGLNHFIETSGAPERRPHTGDFSFRDN